MRDPVIWVHITCPGLLETPHGFLEFCLKQLGMCMCALEVWKPSRQLHLAFETEGRSTNIGVVGVAVTAGVGAVIGGVVAINDRSNSYCDCKYSHNSRMKSNDQNTCRCLVWLHLCGTPVYEPGFLLCKYAF